MKLLLLAAAFVQFSATASAQTDSIPAPFMHDSLAVLTERCRDLLAHSYMAQTLLAQTDSLPGWEGVTVSLYEYKTGIDIYTKQPKTARVWLCDPAPGQLAMWIVTTCWQVKHSVEYKYTDQLFRAVRSASGAQFPVMGLVYEDQYTVGFQEPYVFKDGVTVYIQDSAYIPRNSIATETQLEYYIHLTNAELQPRTGRYARIVSTTREEYAKNGGTVDVGDGDHRKIAWLNVVRDLYKQALHSDRNELMIAWAKEHLK